MNQDADLGIMSENGRPPFARLNVALARPFFDGSELVLLEEVLRSGWVTQGPRIAEFESSVASYVGAHHAVATSNCTTSMHVAWLLNEIGLGHDVICPSYSFIASANAIRHAGATPVFVDINETLNLDVQETRKCIEHNYDSSLRNLETGNRLRAILLVHQIGMPADIDAFSALCREFGLVLVEDAACAIGSTYKNQRIGGSGNLCAFSFHPRKVISTGEGGMLTLNDSELLGKARTYRAHGMSVSDLERHSTGSTTFEEYQVVGYNYRMTDLQAALGISQMRLLPWILENRVRIAERYDQAFGTVNVLECIGIPDYVSLWNRQSYPLRLKNGSLSSRNKLMDFLDQRGVSTRRGIPPIHKEPVYNRGQVLPVTESISESSFFIPIYAQMSDAEVDYVIESVFEGCKRVL